MSIAALYIIAWMMGLSFGAGLSFLIECAQAQMVME
jgi:hypothetical protein